MLTLEEVFPPFGLVITCGPVELRVGRDEDIPSVVDVVVAGTKIRGNPATFVVFYLRPGEPGQHPTLGSCGR